MKTVNSQHGFTLVEVVIALAITAALIMGVIAAQGGLRQESSFNTSIDRIQNSLVRVQNEAFSGVKTGTAGVGKSDTVIFGKLVQFNDAAGEKGKMKVYTLIGDAEDPDALLQACDEEVIDLPNQLEFGGTAAGAPARQAIIFTRESGAVFASPSSYSFTPTASCNPPVLATGPIENGAPPPAIPPPPPPPPLSQCSDTIDNDGDTKIDFPADPGCINPADNNEFNAPPVPVSISPPFATIFAVGSPPTATRTFLIRNVSSSASITLTTLLFGGPGAANFTFTSGGSGCAGKTLAPLATCSVEVRFSVPPCEVCFIFNAVTLTVNNANNVAPSTASIYGFYIKFEDTTTYLPTNIAAEPIYTRNVLSRLIPAAHAAAIAPKTCSVVPCNALDPKNYSSTSDFYTNTGGMDIPFILQGEANIGYIHVDSTRKTVTERFD